MRVDVLDSDDELAGRGRQLLRRDPPLVCDNAMQPDHLAADVHFAVRDYPVLVRFVQQPRCEAERADEEFVRCGNVPIHEQRHDVWQILHATILGRSAQRI